MGEARDPYGDPEVNEFLEFARREMFPKMRASAISIIIAADPDPKLCIELGAAILYDKPIIAVVPKGRACSANLKRVASAIVEGDMNDPEIGRRLQEALSRLLANDARCNK